MNRDIEEFEVTEEQADEASEESFPASDPPAYSDPAESVGTGQDREDLEREDGAGPG